MEVSLCVYQLLECFQYLIPCGHLAALPPSLNFLSVTGDYAEGEMLTASYGYVGGHEGKSIYEWYLHEVLILQ